MQYSNTTTKAGIIQRTEDLINQSDTYISDDATRLKVFTAYANEEMSRVWHTIFENSGNWSFDDNNQDDLPVASTNLVEDQDRYAIPTGALTIKRVEVLDESDNELKLYPKNLSDIKVAVEEFLDASGIPKYYLLENGSIRLFPASNYDKNSGLKVYYDRGMVSFATDDTTQTPGFASPYHEVIPLGMAIKWLSIKTPESNNLPLYRDRYQKMIEDIKVFYRKRFKNYNQRVRRKPENFK